MSAAERELHRLCDDLLARHAAHGWDAPAFWAAQYDAGLAWVHFPPRNGGLGLEPGLQRLVDGRLRATGAPDNTFDNFIGVGMAAPVLLAYGGREEHDTLLRPLFTCEHIWCQLFSEPGAGSDLASLATTAERDGDTWVVNGQKVWTTMAHIARWGLLIARSDPGLPKHRGLTFFYVDMRAVGIEVRPLRQMTGMADFNEVYLTDVRVPDSQRLGAVGDGWKVATSTLMSERSAIGAVGNGRRGSGPIGRATALARRYAAGDPVLADRFARLWIESEVIRLTSARAKESGPGPEAAIAKLAASQFQQRVHEFCLDVLGAGGLLVSGYEQARPTRILESMAGDDVDPALAYLRTRGMTIAGGTTEIARNVIGERILGLPPEPRTDKDRPWAQVPRN